MRKEAVRDFISGEPLDSVAERYNVTEQSILNWRKKFPRLRRRIVKEEATGLSSVEHIVMKAQKTVSMPEEKQQEYYRTNSIPLSAFLILSGIQLPVVEDPLADKKTLVFPLTDELEDYVYRYYNHLDTVDPKNYYTAVIEIKKVLFPRV